MVLISCISRRKGTLTHQEAKLVVDPSSFPNQHHSAPSSRASRGLGLPHHSELPAGNHRVRTAGPITAPNRERRNTGSAGAAGLRGGSRARDYFRWDSLQLHVRVSLLLSFLSFFFLFFLFLFIYTFFSISCDFLIFL